MTTATILFSRWIYMACLICVCQLIFISYAHADVNDILTDIDEVKKYWSNLREYEDIPADKFGVEHTGMPSGCQVEQVQVLHRHAARYPSSEEFIVINALKNKILAGKASGTYSGLLGFLNTWSFEIGNNVLLPAGVSMGHKSGTSFWIRYGRLLYNAKPGQSNYNATDQVNPLLRCNTIPRVVDTANAWADGFFGEYNATNKYSLLAIPFGDNINNTLAAFSSCYNYAHPNPSLRPTQPELTLVAESYLEQAAERLNEDAPPGTNFTTADAFGMQALCTYEYYALGSSDFCNLFTGLEWRGFQYSMDFFMYARIAFGNPLARAVGIGVVEEILARLNGQYISVSDTSVNSTLDSDPATFPLDQKFYFDATNDFTIIAALAAMSMNYFKKDLPPEFSPSLKRKFFLSDITPYAGRLIVEKIGCTSANPSAKRRFVTQYTNTQYGYSSGNATYKFIRMRLNNGILPLNMIPGTFCKLQGRTDGLCPLGRFLNSQQDAKTKANYQVLCFGNYTYNATLFNGDGTYFPPEYAQ